MRVAVSRGPGVHQECDQLLGFPSVLALRSLHERACGEEDLHVEGSAQNPIQGHPESSG